MKKINLILKIIVVFILSFGVAFLTWRFLFAKILENKVKNNIEYLNSVIQNYNYGKYTLKDNIIYDNLGYKIESSEINGYGVFYKTEYGIDSKLSMKSICVYKTSGNNSALVYDGKCKDLKLAKSNITHSQNNSQITVSGDFDYYFVGKINSVPGEWLKKKSGDLVINLPYEGRFKIWVKNNVGVISGVISASVECSLEDANEINDTLIYCTGSKMELDEYSWHVVSDINGELKLLMDAGQIDLMSHCDSGVSEEFCYYKSDILYEEYKWSKSKINEFLNKTLIKRFGDYNLKEYKICDSPSGVEGCKDGDGCAGYLKEEIEKGGYSCKKYSESKIRLLTYNEYNYILNKTVDKKWVYNSKIDNFWLMNGYSEKGYYAFKVNKFGQVYLDAKTNSLLEVRPVITIYK